MPTTRHPVRSCLRFCLTLTDCLATVRLTEHQHCKCDGDGEKALAGLGFAAALAVGVLLIGSGVGKYLTGRFIRDLANYQVLPRAAVPTAARVIPGVEILVGAAMLTSPSAALPAIAAAALFAGYAGAVTVNLLRGRRIACGCHGSERVISWQWPLRTSVGPVWPR